MMSSSAASIGPMSRGVERNDSNCSNVINGSSSNRRSRNRQQPNAIHSVAAMRLLAEEKRVLALEVKLVEAELQKRSIEQIMHHLTHHLATHEGTAAERRLLQLEITLLESQIAVKRVERNMRNISSTLQPERVHDIVQAVYSKPAPVPTIATATVKPKTAKPLPPTSTHSAPAAVSTALQPPAVRGKLASILNRFERVIAQNTTTESKSFLTNMVTTNKSPSATSMRNFTRPPLPVGYKNRLATASGKAPMYNKPTGASHPHSHPHLPTTKNGHAVYQHVRRKLRPVAEETKKQSKGGDSRNNIGDDNNNKEPGASPTLAQARQALRPLHEQKNPEKFLDGHASGKNDKAGTTAERSHSPPTESTVLLEEEEDEALYKQPQPQNDNDEEKCLYDEYSYMEETVRSFMEETGRSNMPSHLLGSYGSLLYDDDEMEEETVYDEETVVSYTYSLVNRSRQSHKEDDLVSLQSELLDLKHELSEMRRLEMQEERASNRDDEQSIASLQRPNHLLIQAADGRVNYLLSGNAMGGSSRKLHSSGNCSYSTIHTNEDLFFEEEEVQEESLHKDEDNDYNGNDPIRFVPQTITGDDYESGSKDDKAITSLLDSTRHSQLARDLQREMMDGDEDDDESSETDDDESFRNSDSEDSEDDDDDEEDEDDSSFSLTVHGDNDVSSVGSFDALASKHAFTAKLLQYSPKREAAPVQRAAPAMLDPAGLLASRFSIHKSDDEEYSKEEDDEFASIYEELEVLEYEEFTEYTVEEEEEIVVEVLQPSMEESDDEMSTKDGDDKTTTPQQEDIAGEANEKARDESQSPSIADEASVPPQHGADQVKASVDHGYEKQQDTACINRHFDESTNVDYGYEYGYEEHFPGHESYSKGYGYDAKHSTKEKYYEDESADVDYGYEGHVPQQSQFRDESKVDLSETVAEEFWGSKELLFDPDQLTDDEEEEIIPLLRKSAVGSNRPNEKSTTKRGGRRSMHGNLESNSNSLDGGLENSKQRRTSSMHNMTSPDSLRIDETEYEDDEDAEEEANRREIFRLAHEEKGFKDIVDEAASLGRLTRLREHVVEANGKKSNQKKTSRRASIVATNLLDIQWNTTHHGNVCSELVELGAFFRGKEVITESAHPSNGFSDVDAGWDVDQTEYNSDDEFACDSDNDDELGRSRHIEATVKRVKEEDREKNSRILQHLQNQHPDEVDLPERAVPRAHSIIKKQQHNPRALRRCSIGTITRTLTQDVIQRHSEREARISAGQLHMKGQCSCPYCYTASPFQTYAYKKELEKREGGPAPGAWVRQNGKWSRAQH